MIRLASAIRRNALIRETGQRLDREWEERHEGD